VSYKQQELLTLPEQLGSPSFFAGIRIANLRKNICVVFFGLFVFFRNACTKSGPLRFSQFSDC